MTKKKKQTRSDGVSGQTLRPTPEIEESFTVGKWRGLVQWRCALCAWDTLDSEEAMWAHLRDVHAPKPKVERRMLPLVDRFGNLIEAVIEEEV